MNSTKMNRFRVTLLGSCLALLGLAPLACDDSLDGSDDDDEVIHCDAAPMECWDQGCVGEWGQLCVVQGDVCLPAPEHPTLDPAKCFRAACYCGEGCAWDGVQCSVDGGCPALPPPTAPTEPSPYPGQDGFPNSSWNPAEGLSLTWYEPAELYLPYEIAVRRSPHLSGSCMVPDTGMTERVATTTYDLYFGLEPEPPLLQAAIPTASADTPGFVTVKAIHWLESNLEFQEANFHVPGPLLAETSYFWRVVVRNGDGAEVSSPIWQFTTAGPGEDESCPGTPTVVDAEGNSYDTVQIGSQCWTRKALVLGDLCEGYYTCQADNGNVEKSCQFDEPNCYGHYTWNELMQYGAGSICPSGWHIPTNSEWQTMFAHPDRGRLYPSYGGFINFDNTKGGLGATAYVWTADEQTSGLEGVAYAAIIAWPTKNLPPELSTFNKGNRLTAMCVKN